MALRKWGEETLVNSQVTSIQRNASISSLPGGGFVVVWMDGDASGDGSFTSIKMQRFGANGQKVGTETLVNTTATSVQSLPAVAVLADGNMVVSWEDDSNALGAGSDIRFRRFDADGAAIDPADISLSYANMEEVPDITALSNGGFAIAYAENFGEGDIFLEVFDAAGIAQQHVTISASANREFEPHVAQLSNGRLAITWTDIIQNHVKMQIYDPDAGVLRGGVVTVSMANLTGVGQPESTALVDGRFVVVWTGYSPLSPAEVGTSIMARIYSAGTSPIGGTEFIVNTSQAGNQFSPAVAALPNGGFVVVYESPMNTGIGIRIVAQLFNSDGSREGNEYIVDTTTASFALDPDVTVLDDGRIVVTWNSSGGSIGEVMMQIIDPREGLVFGTLEGETLFGNDAFGDEINGLGGADTLHGLAGSDIIYGGDGDDQIYGGRGDDTLYGGRGNDLLDGAGGADEFHGGGGSDTVTFRSSGSGVNVNLATGKGTLGDALNDQFFGIANILGSNFSDNLTGGNAGSRLEGFNGNDVLSGGSAADRLLGGINNDVLNAKKGTDLLFGGAGFDRFVFAGGDSGQTTGSSDKIMDYEKGVAGIGDKIDFATTLSIGGSAAVSTTRQASINVATGVATFGKGSGVDMLDALSDITLRFTAAGNAAGEFALFQLAGVGDYFLLVSDGNAGVTANDVLVRLNGITTIGSLDLAGGDLTLLT